METIRDGAYLKAWRKSRDLTGAACADAFGISRRTLTAYEALTGEALPEKITARMESYETGDPVTVADPISEPGPVKAAPVKAKARTGDVAAPVKIVGQTPRGLNIGEDGRLYGHFQRVADQPKLAKLLQGTGARWTERFPSANGFGLGSSIMWGVLKGEAESDCAPVLAGRHYAPSRANVNRTGGEPLPKKAA